MKMKNLEKKYLIKIPNKTTVFYCNNKKIITIIGPIAKKSLKLKVKINLLKNLKIIEVSSNPFIKISQAQRKKIFSLQGTTTALIKQLILETSHIFYKKLQLVGVGYRTFDIENFENKILALKVGHSHSIYIKIPSELKIFCLKKTKLFICGNFYSEVTQRAAFIRNFKKPEPYKGKGILYENEKIVLKEGKKI